jgi:ATP-dependent DNA helicase RecG
LTTRTTKPAAAKKTAASPKKKAAPARAAGATTLQARLAKLGLKSRLDLVLHLPLRYEDETRITPITELVDGVFAQVEGEIAEATIQYRPRRTLIVKLTEPGGVLHLRFLNFYGSQVKQLTEGKRLRVSGEARTGFFGAEMIHPRYHEVQEGAPLPTALTPVYPATAGLGQATLRRVVVGAIDSARRDGQLTDTAPPEVSARLALMPFAEAIHALHFPAPGAGPATLDRNTHPAWRRLKFDELLAQQLSLQSAYRARRLEGAPRLVLRAGPHEDALQERLLAALPFGLTGAQQRVRAEILRDLEAPHPMRRLLQGDVGSGKTIVAALAACRAIDCGYQAVFMAPTEILAEQHYRKLTHWLEPLGVRIAWLSGSLKKRDKAAAAESIASGAAQLAIGTHALFQDSVTFDKLGLVIVDEQHRFGVGQRLALSQKAGGLVPHQLMMSATPIPRTLAMTFYADLDVSVIDEMPPGRTPVKTKLAADTRRDEVIARILDACGDGRQVYWVCPLIEESETLQLKTAVETHQRLTEMLPGLTVGLVHGRLKPAEKAAAMAQFVAGATDVLVATTVIEVGVDVPNASLMVVEHAERFGLSQLHQLRGRVGRGVDESVCILLYQHPLSEHARQRLKVMFESTDGFEIARADLALRGPGEFLGTAQSGVPLLRFADLEADAELIEHARDCAARMLDTGDPLAAAHLARWLGSRESYLLT